MQDMLHQKNKKKIIEKCHSNEIGISEFLLKKQEKMYLSTLVGTNVKIISLCFSYVLLGLTSKERVVVRLKP